MSKTSEAVDDLNEAQKEALRKLCNDEMEPAEKKGWFYPGKSVRTSDPLQRAGLVERDWDDGGKTMVKPTALGRRVGKSLMVCLMALFLPLASCGDKIQTAKTALAFVNIGLQTASTAIKAAAASKRTECLKKGVEGSPEFTACYASTAKMMEALAKIEPQVDTAMENAAKYIKAAESGQSADYAAAVKQTVCLLTQIANIIPGDTWAKLKKKIEMYLALAAAYACEKPTAAVASQPTERQVQLLRQGLQLLREIRG